MTIPSLIAGREVVYFIHGGTDGLGNHLCHACGEAAPEFERFERANPTLLTLSLNAGSPIVAKLGLKITETPTYLYRRGNEGLVRTGALSAKEIAQWISAIQKGAA